MTEERDTSSADDEFENIKRSLSVIGTELYSLLHRIAPADAQEHFKNAHVETLKGLRVLIDRRIEHLSSREKRGTPIEVE